MSYQVSRNGQLYGPYTLEDLQRYVATGNVLPTDLAKSEDMPDWLPVSQLLAASGAALPEQTPPYVPSYATPAAYTAPATPYPDPPNLNWGLVLLFGILTCGIFNIVYDFIQVLWLKKVEPASVAIFWYIGFVVLEVLNIGNSLGRFALLAHGVSPYQSSRSASSMILSSFISIGILVTALAYRFIMKSELERHFNGPEPIGLRLSGVMTFFFAGLYFQYHFNRINEIKQAMRYRGAAL